VEKNGHSTRLRKARKQIRFHPSLRAAGTAVILTLTASVCTADIYQWEWVDPSNHSLGKKQSAVVTPGGVGVSVPTAPPEIEWFSSFLVDLTNRDLSKAYLIGTYPQNFNFANSNLTDADLSKANLRNSNFGYYSRFGAPGRPAAILTGATFDGATISYGQFTNSTARGFTASQLYSTASYQNRDLTGIRLDDNNLQSWSFAEQNLTQAWFPRSNLVNADFGNAILVQTELFDADVSGANFNGAQIRESSVSRASGFSASQLLSTWNYKSKNMGSVSMEGMDLNGVDFSGHNLTDAGFEGATLTGAVFSGAIVNGTRFAQWSSAGITFAQIASTASYQARDLRRIEIDSDQSSAWDLSGQDLTGATLGGLLLFGANLRNANLTNAALNGGITGTDLTDSLIAGAELRATMTLSQIYTTASYKNHQLDSIKYHVQDLSGADFSNQDLSHSDFSESNLSAANFTDAIIAGARFGNAGLFVSAQNFSAPQLYSTASYHLHDLHEIGLAVMNLSGWDLRDQNLRKASFESANLATVDFSGADVTEANFAGASGFTQAQLYSTASYQHRDLRGVQFSAMNLTGFDFSGQDLRWATFGGSSLQGARFQNADLRDGSFYDADFTGADLTRTDLRGLLGPTGAIIHNTILYDGTLDGLRLAAGESLVIRNTPTPIHVSHEFAVAPKALLDMVFSAEYIWWLFGDATEHSGWGSTIGFDPGMPVDLAGTLRLGLGTYYFEYLTPLDAVGTSWQLFDWTGVSPTGQFDQIVSSEPWLVWDTSQLYTNGTVTLVSVPEPGTVVAWVFVTGACVGRRHRRVKRLS
jgi:uncharacterized protein YjbI with pentapeptide repeats